MVLSQTLDRQELVLTDGTAAISLKSCGNALVARSQTPWPAEVDFVLSALDVGHRNGPSRRVARRRYRVTARLWLCVDREATAPRLLYTRDVNQRGLGFITRQRLPLGYGGRVEVVSPDGTVQVIGCMLLRCREAVGGWFEGALHFNREQWAFGPHGWAATSPPEVHEH